MKPLALYLMLSSFFIVSAQRVHFPKETRQAVLYKLQQILQMPEAQADPKNPIVDMYDQIQNELNVEPFDSVFASSVRSQAFDVATETLDDYSDRSREEIRKKMLKRCRYVLNEWWADPVIYFGPMPEFLSRNSNLQPSSEIMRRLKVHLLVSALPLFDDDLAMNGEIDTPFGCRLDPDNDYCQVLVPFVMTAGACLFLYAVSNN